MTDATVNDRERSELRSAHGLRALWRGKLPLRFVFWVLNVAVHVLVNAVLAAVEWWGGRAFDESRWVLDLLVVLVILLYAVYTIVAWVGLWLSAGHYPGRRVWRVLARLTVLASVVWIGAAIAAEVFISEFE